MFRRRLSVLVTPAITFGVALAAVAACSTGGTPTAAGGNGASSSSSMPAPDKLLDTVRTAAQNASAVHIKGSGLDSGTKMSLDMQLNKDGSASGTIDEGGSTISLVVADKVYYIQFTPSLMSTAGIDPAGDVGKLLVNKWVPSTSKMLAGSDMVDGLKPATDYNTFVPGLFDQMKGSDVPKSTGTDTVDGVPVAVYTFSDGSKADIATSTPHYLIRLIEPPSQGKGQLDFTGWDKPVTVSKPSAAEIYSGPGS